MNCKVMPECVLQRSVDVVPVGRPHTSKQGTRFHHRVEDLREGRTLLAPPSRPDNRNACGQPYVRCTGSGGHPVKGDLEGRGGRIGATQYDVLFLPSQILNLELAETCSAQDALRMSVSLGHPDYAIRGRPTLEGVGSSLALCLKSPLTTTTGVRSLSFSGSSFIAFGLLAG
jgi:hypothetical protein